MCGYLRRHIKPKTLREFLELLGLNPEGEAWADAAQENADAVVEHFYPVWGGNASRMIKGLIIQEDEQLKLIDATWWYHCEEKDGDLVVGAKQTFNARNLHLEFWRNAIKRNRAIAVVTGLGEGKTINGKNRHFLVTAERLLFLGAVYKKHPCGKYSCAIITRDEHPRFEPYHDKAFPLFLPYNLDFLRLWLGDADDQDPLIAQLLASPKIFTDLTITPVKTFKNAEPTGPKELLTAD